MSSGNILQRTAQSYKFLSNFLFNMHNSSYKNRLTAYDRAYRQKEEKEVREGENRGVINKVDIPVVWT